VGWTLDVGPATTRCCWPGSRSWLGLAVLIGQLILTTDFSLAQKLGLQKNFTV